MTRAFTSASNRSWGARPFSLGHLRLILTNPIYCGEIAHKGERFKAQHPPIIAAETFAAVQQRLASSRRESRIRATATEANLLSRLLFDADGRPLVGDHGKKASRRYRYYVSKPDSAEALRIPAGEIEPLVLQALATHLCDRSWLMDTLLPAGASPELIEYLGREAATLAAELQHLTPSRQCAALQTIVERITIRRDRLAIALKPDPFGLVSMGDDAERDAAESDAPAVIDVPARFVKRGQQLHLVVPPRDGEDPSVRLDKPLIKALARAVTWYDDLVTGKADTIREIAEQEKVSERYVAQLLPLAFLKPALVEAALDGTGALTISRAEIAKGIALPVEWEAQAALS